MIGGFKFGHYNLVEHSFYPGSIPLVVRPLSILVICVVSLLIIGFFGRTLGNATGIAYLKFSKDQPKKKSNPCEDIDCYNKYEQR